MMPGTHNIPPAVPIYPNGRRQNEYAYPYHPQPHPFAGYPQPQFHPQQHAPHYGQQWYPYPPQPYSPVPRQYHAPPIPPQHHGPVIVSSHLPSQSTAPMQRPSNPTPTPTTPSLIHATTPPQHAPSTPSVTSQMQESPATSTTSVSASTPPPSTSSHSSIPVLPTPDARKMAWRPTLPWYSVPEVPFPPRAPRRRRRVRATTGPNTLELPARPDNEEQKQAVDQALQTEPAAGAVGERTSSQSSIVAAPSDHDTPATSLVPSDTDSTQPPTPSSTAVPSSSSRAASSSTHTRTATKPVVPVVPVTPKVPIPPKAQSTASQNAMAKEGTPEKVPEPPGTHTSSSDTTQSSHTLVASLNDEAGDPENETQIAVSSPPKPKTWADLVRTKPSGTTAASNGLTSTPNTDHSGSTKSGSLVEALRTFSVNSALRISFLEPRGLVNTGNMCYMNSILQVLVFCIPFYDFLDQIGKRAAHTFKSDTPLLDAMIMFMREFKVIDSAESVEKLRMRLKDTELEQYGEQFTPEYVYDVTKRLPRFAHMRRGHQQDAEEFLGFLLQALHDECAHVMLSLPTSPSEQPPISLTSEKSAIPGTTGGWLEVGPKQKASVTRSSGDIAIDTPITKIFGGSLRSELRVPGAKNSVTLQPYQPLQLDISSLDVHNITDALKGLTRSETLHGEFKSPRGPSATATKQVFIESLPPVLILHLKRFQYDNTGGAQKIWKRVGYPLDLEIPKEVFPPHKRGGATISGLPKYRLISVVYHHGKSAAGGHYTVDVRRQDGLEWIRLDDTIIRRLRTEDVAAGGAEEDPRVLAKALEQHKKDSVTGKNSIYQQLEEEDEDKQSDGGEWSQVNGTVSKETKKWSAVTNGSTSPSTAGKRTPKHLESVKDNKVAYILFYRRIE